MTQKDELCYKVREIKDLEENPLLFGLNKKERIKAILGHWDFLFDIDLHSKVGKFKLEQLIELLEKHV